MSGRWKEVVRLSFKGERFKDHALDLAALGELVQFQRMITETAKSLWRSANPDRERLPSRFEERIRLCLRRIKSGSAVVPLEVYIKESKQAEMFKREPIEVTQAITLAHDTFRAIERRTPVPDALPKALIPEYSKWGRQLLQGEAIELIVKRKKPVKVSAPTQEYWSAYIEPAHQNVASVTGTILEVDVRQGHFQIWQNDKSYVTAKFRPDQEEVVTDALKKHKKCRVDLKGRGEFSEAGRLLRVIGIENMKLHPIDETSEPDLFANPIEQVLAELSNEIPIDEWKSLPTDLSDNLDHYLYGWPKK
jgi:hypothetical protein